MVNNPFSLEGKTILVTGASSGIGRGICIQCSRMGAKLVLNGRNCEKLNETMSLLSGSGHIIIASDISQQDGIDRLVESCPAINGFVNCAGILEFATVKSIRRPLLSKVLDTNAVAPIMLTQGLLKKKRMGANSSIVFISSLSGNYIGGTGEIAYSFSKAAINGYVKTAALELGPRSIRMNTVCPALVPTDLSIKYHEIVDEEKMKAEIPTKYPLGRMGTVEDVANATIYLLSDASSWVTGTDIILDGGLTLK